MSLYAVSLALNIVFTRAWATHIGPGMAAALDYCMRGVGVPLAFLVSPISNSLLPEIARLRAQLRFGQAFRLIDRTLGLAALGAVAACGVALALRHPVIAILFQRGNFTAESTNLVSAVFLGMAPSLIGWSLLELTGRALFALDRPVLALSAAIIPVLVNVALTLWLHSSCTAVDRAGRVRGIDGWIPDAVRRRARQPQALDGRGFMRIVGQARGLRGSLSPPQLLEAQFYFEEEGGLRGHRRPRARPTSALTSGDAWPAPWRSD